MPFELCACVPSEDVALETGPEPRPGLLPFPRRQAPIPLQPPILPDRRLTDPPMPPPWYVVIL